MADQPEIRTDRGFDRFVYFSDAVVAIAISLLILPVVDAVSDSKETQTAANFFDTNGSRLFAFALSFVVIASFWVNHHQLFESVKAYSTALLWLNLAWLLTIVFLPLPTELLAVKSVSEGFVRFLYIGSVFLSNATMVGLQVIVDRTPSLRRDPDAVPPPLAARLVTPGIVLVALIVGVAVPSIGLWAMFLMFLSGPLTTRFARR